MNRFIEISPEVLGALEKGGPVVVLESTIISHGMPYPQNVETALAVEDIVRQNGAVPATIAIFGGKCRVGLGCHQLEYFGKADNVWKVSLRDMAFVLAQQHFGATTVAATMRIANMAGIKVFVTGGIGGVHRGAESTMDISADLTEMAQTPVAVVSAGVKSILDIGRTLEYLETLGVPVVTYGQDAFPSFYSRHSGHGSPLRMDNADDLAVMVHTQWQMGLSGAVLIANPVPVEDEIEAAEMETHIGKALEAARQNGVRGKEVTPFLLKYIADHTNGESLDANIALIKHNAELGARLARAYSRLSPKAGF